jgi:hypothetical protein
MKRFDVSCVRTSFFSVCLLLIVCNLNAQMFEELKKEKTVASARMVLGAYAGYGLSFYSYDSNEPLTPITGYTPSPVREMRSCAVVPVHLHMLFKMGSNVYLGGGVDYQLVTANENSLGSALRFSITKPVARIEIQPKPGRNLSVAYFIQAGPGFVSNGLGEDYSIAFGGTTGSLFSVHVGKVASLSLGISMGWDTFSSTINKQSSRHNSIVFAGLGGIRIGI